ncbi:MAG: peptide chain release factor N(5)-glutamine methyltransferase [Patescibacteria group bacterium]|jgi:release factor glutamine methyltransferase
MTIKNICQDAQKSYPQLPLGDIELLLAESLHRSLNYLYKNPEKILSRSNQTTFWRLLERRKKKFSIAYLTRARAFFGLDFYVSSHVLVPRPESELLVEEGLKYLKNKKNPNIIDVGTGSGCLIISLAKNYQSSSLFYAVDNSGRALKVAKTNARKHDLKSQINFLKSNLLNKVGKNKFDLILANLPYLTKKQLQEPSIKKEPLRALYGGSDGLSFYKTLLKQIPSYLNKKYLVLLEIDPQQELTIQKISKQYLPKAKLEIIRDLNKQARVLKIENN